MTTRVSRAQVLAFRVAAQGLHREASAIADLGVLDLGVQEAMGQPAALAFAARLPESVDLSPDAVETGPGTDLALVWSLRGAPHVHRRSDLDALARALWPLSEADATGRLNETGPSVAKKGIPALDQFASAVAEMRAAVTKPTGKGAVSTAVSRALPPAMLRECRACKTSHISDSAMRTSFLAAGLEMEPGTAPPVLLRRPKAKLPKKADLAALTTLARAYLAYLGPATVGDFAGYLEGRRTDVARAWPDDLVEVDLDGRTAYLPSAHLDALRKAPEPDLARLLGPFDPFMQARDRDLIVRDKAVQKALWPVLGRPGVVLVDGEVAGTWRPKSSGRKLTLTVEAYLPVRPAAWKRIEAEAERVAQVKGARDVTLVRT